MKILILAILLAGANARRTRQLGEIIPTEVEQSAHNENVHSATDMSFSYGSATGDGDQWFRMKLDEVYCITKVIRWEYNGDPLTTWTCSESGCTCAGFQCNIYRLSISTRGTLPDDSPPADDCMYGDTAQIDSHRGVTLREITIHGKREPCLPGEYLDDEGVCQECTGRMSVRGQYLWSTGGDVSFCNVCWLGYGERMIDGHCGGARERLPGEIVPVAAEVSAISPNNCDEATCGPALAIDLWKDTASVVVWDTDGDYTSWIRLRLDRVHCIKEIIWFWNYGTVRMNYTCPEEDTQCTCSTPTGSYCDHFTLTISTTGAEDTSLAAPGTEDSQDTLGDPNCGDTIQFNNNQQGGYFYLHEIAVVGRGGDEEGSNPVFEFETTEVQCTRRRKCEVKFRVTKEDGKIGTKSVRFCKLVDGQPINCSKVSYKKKTKMYTKKIKKAKDTHSGEYVAVVVQDGGQDVVSDPVTVVVN